MILTVTLNPALDALVFLQHFKLHGKNIAREKHLSPSGKGYNVARALAGLGLPVTAIGLIGRAELEFYKTNLGTRGIALDLIPIAATRTNQKLIELDTGLETEINEPGAPVVGAEVDAFLLAFERHLQGVDWVVFSGSVAPGIDRDIYRRLIEQAKLAGARTALDTSGEFLKEGALACPTILRLNRTELAELSGSDAATPVDMASRAASFLAGGTDLVVVSSGKSGAVLADHTGAWHAAPPPVNVVNAIGAGDVMTAGVLDGLIRELEPRALLRWATALASSSVTTLESGEPDPLLAREIEPAVIITALH